MFLRNLRNLRIWILTSSPPWPVMAGFFAEVAGWRPPRRSSARGEPFPRACYNLPMPDNIESRMNFIIEQQAQFAAGIQLLKERESEILRMIEANAGMIRQLVDVTFSLAHHSEESDRRLEQTDRRIQELVESDRRFAASMQELRDSHVHSDRRLDALIDVVEKLTRRNGPQP